jgi:hypothetical protein
MSSAGQSSRQHALLLRLMSNNGVTVDVLTDEGNEPVCFFKVTEVIHKGILGLVGTAKQGVDLPVCVNVDMHTHTKRCHFLSSCSTFYLTLRARLTKWQARSP